MRSAEGGGKKAEVRTPAAKRSLGQSRIVDGFLCRAGYADGDMGWVQAITSDDAATGGMVNQIKFTYDGWGNILKSEQAHDGAVDRANDQLHQAVGAAAGRETADRQRGCHPGPVEPGRDAGHDVGRFVQWPAPWLDHATDPE